MKINRKGFTLIELLTAIVIIALVVSLSVYGILKVRENSEGKANAVSLDSIKVSARVYSGEAPSDSWKELKDEYTYDAFCVTVGELKSKGLLGADVTLPKGIEENTYILVKRNKTTLAIIEESLDEENIGNICEGKQNAEGENATDPKITGYNSYTDKLVFSFVDTYDANLIASHSCLYGETSANIKREGKIINNTCEITGLKNNKEYWVRIYTNTKKGSTVSTTSSGVTSNFNPPSIEQIKNTSKVKITYNNKDTKGNPVNSPSYYFYSGTTLGGQLNVNAEECDSKFNCTGSTKTIKTNIWYKVNTTEITITYPEDNNSGNIKARIYDKSGNSGEANKDIIIKKHTATFNKNTAQSISYGSQSCIATGNGSCTIKSPTITPKTGYHTIGFNQTVNATTSTLNENTNKGINSNVTYYAITKVNSYTVKYSCGSGTGSAPASQTVKYGETFNLSSNTCTKSEHAFNGWLSSAGGTTYSSGSSAKNLTDVNGATITMTAQWKLTTPTITINANKFVCEDTNRLAVYFVTTCTGNACVYNKKNGLNNSYNFSLDTTGIPTWSISKTSYSDTVEGVGSNCSKQYLYVNTSVACRSGASTSGTTTEYSWSACTPVYAYRTTMKVDGDTNWYYSSTYGCYMHGDYLSTSEPSSCSSSGQVGLCGSCSSNTDCSVGTCSGTCTSGGRSYSCCVTSGSSQCN